MKNVFDQQDALDFIRRINALSPETVPLWGKMTVEQMLAHCNVTYEMIYENYHPRPNSFVKLILKLFVKNTVVSKKPYKQNGQTAPQFIIKDDRDFHTEKTRLIDYIIQTQQLGEHYFDGRESHSFGVLTVKEWNAMLSKHLEHHLSQFGV